MLGDLVEAQVLVDRRHRELGRVDGAQLEGRVDVAARQQLGRHAHLLHHLRAQAEEAHLQALEVVERLDGLAEPARTLRRDQVARHPVQVVPVVDLRQQLLAAAVVHPRQRLAGGGAEGHRGEELHRRDLAGPVARRRPPRVDRPGRDGVENLQRRHQRAGLEELELHRPAREHPDALLDHPALVAELDHLAGERARHLPADLRARGGRVRFGRRLGRRLAAAGPVAAGVAAAQSVHADQGADDQPGDPHRHRRSVAHPVLPGRRAAGRSPPIARAGGANRRTRA